MYRDLSTYIDYQIINVYTVYTYTQCQYCITVIISVNHRFNLQNAPFFLIGTQLVKNQKLQRSRCGLSNVAGARSLNAGQGRRVDEWERAERLDLN